MTELFSSLQSRNFGLATQLANSGVGLGYQKRDGTTLLHLAIDKQAPEDLVLLLLQFGANPNAELKYIGITPMHLAAKHSRPDLVQLLFDFGGKVDFESCVGATPLLVGANSNCTPATVQRLIECGANINYVDHDLLGSVFWAVQCGASQSLVEQLLASGADPNCQSKRYKTSAVQLAITSNLASPVLLCLLKFGADLDLAIQQAEQLARTELVADLKKIRLLLAISAPKARKHSRSPARLLPSELVRSLRDFI
ncbi:hypothetical protein BASA81_007373 [Batrachochytrium salamandrivorans]|nr:hypothetical protein BASA81_007373 [Batrachochytrium salamandrivorans]